MLLLRSRHLSAELFELENGERNGQVHLEYGCSIECGIFARVTTRMSMQQSPGSNMQKAMPSFVKTSNRNSQSDSGSRRNSSTTQRRIKQQQRLISSQDDTPPRRTTRRGFKIQNLVDISDGMSHIRGRAVGVAVAKDTDGEAECPVDPIPSEWRKPAAERTCLAPSGELIVHLLCMLAGASATSIPS